MHIKKLNEEFKKLNEISDEVKERVINKRRELAQKANDKLLKSSKLMAKSNVGAPKTIKLTLDHGYCQTEQCIYNEGTNGVTGAYWDNHNPKTIELNLEDPQFAKSLAKAAGDFMDCYWVGDDTNNISLYCEGEIIELRFSVMGDDDNEEPTESQYAQWEEGKTDLWIIDGFITLNVDELDLPYLITALENAKVQVDEF